MFCKGVEATGRGVHEDSPARVTSHRWRQGATTHRRGSGQERPADKVSILILCFFIVLKDEKTVMTNCFFCCVKSLIIRVTINYKHTFEIGFWLIQIQTII